MQKEQRNFFLWVIILGGLGLFLYAIRSVLLPFTLGILIAYFFNPVCIWLEKKKISRGLSSALIIASFFTICGVVITALAPLLYEQTIHLLDVFPSYFKQIQQELAPQINQLMAKYNMIGTQDVAIKAANGLSDQIGSVAQNIATGLLQSGSTVISLVSVIVITPMVGFYLLRDWDDLLVKFDALLPRKYAVTIKEQLGIIDTTIAGFIRGQLNMCLIIGCYYTLALSLIGIDFAFILGIMTGLLLIIPMVGTLASAAITLAVCWFQFGTMAALLKVICVYALGMLIDNILTPKLVGSKVGLHPVWIIFGMFCGGALLGFVGVLLAIPLTAIIGVLVRFSIQRYLGSELYASNDTP